MEDNHSFSIRPAGRHILTIGRDLIQDKTAAILELVKNAYDADSPDVKIIFRTDQKTSKSFIIIEDHGHGMSRDTVINNWLVPSTDYKLKIKKSPRGRPLQGSKGIGRYAASILGKDLLLDTVQDNIRTTVFIEWEEFTKVAFLDEVKILVESQPTKLQPGTCMTISLTEEDKKEWLAISDKEKKTTKIDQLINDLKKLTTPLDNFPGIEEYNEKEEINKFKIFKAFENFFEDQNRNTEDVVKPYPIIEFYDYRIAGKISEEGIGSLQYYLQKSNDKNYVETIDFSINKNTGCGNLNFDIRVYDRESTAIDALIMRGLKDEQDKYLGRLETRKLLNEYNGISVYRNGFRIRPLGDPDFDWLKLNARRVQTPALRIGSNQVIGYVQIETEKKSGLIEKSARDGLLENSSFDNLKEITLNIISELESRRYVYRRKTQLLGPQKIIEKNIGNLYQFDTLKKEINSSLLRKGISHETSEEILKIIDKDEFQRNEIATEIKATVAIYQGQATLGKIINVILHEGRRPLNYFKNQIPNLKYWNNSLKEHKQNVLEKIIPISEGIERNAESFVSLFSRLDPLAAGKRGNKKETLLKKAIEQSFEVFQNTLEEQNIQTQIHGSDNYYFYCWPQDIVTIFVNLIDNSIYWLENIQHNKKIEVFIEVQNQQLKFIDYQDTGPGILPKYIDSEVIFEPEFSTKSEGTGLGLAIAGEAAIRNNLKLKAFHSKNGVHFRLQPEQEGAQHIK